MSENFTKLLIIDDELLLRNGIKYLCNWEKYGFTIVGEASNGLDGLKMVEQVHPDIIITDILMSVMDGIELTQKIKEQYPWIHIVILSSYDDFCYVKSLFKLGIADYLLKPTLEIKELLALLNRLKSNITSIDSEPYRISSSHILKELIHGSVEEHENLLQNFQNANITFEENYPFFLLCCSTFSEHSLFAYEKEISLSLSEYPGSYKRVTCICDCGNLCILLQLPPTKVEVDSNYISSLSQVLSNTLHFSVIFSISKPFQSLCEVSKYYNFCLGLLEYKFYFPEQTVISYRDIKSHPLEFPTESFCKTLDPLNLNMAFSVLNEYLHHAVRFPSTEVFTLKKQIEGSLYSLIQALTSAGFETSVLHMEKIKYFKRIDKSQDYHELEKILKEFFLLLETTLDSETQKRESDLFYKIQQYIEENCYQELKLSDLANIFHLNYTYLSTIFYQKTKEHFSDYLNRIRIEKAKQLLQTQNLSIQQISMQAGFMNQGYFSKIFKNHVGLSPKEYQQIYQKRKK